MRGNGMDRLDPGLMKKLFREYRRNPSDALRHYILTESMHVVHTVVLTWGFPYQDIDDMMNVGFLGLQNAFGRYEPDHKSGASFYTYARYMVKGEIQRHLRRDARDRGIPRWLYNYASVVAEAEETLAAGNGKKPAAAEIAYVTGLSEQMVQKILGARGMLTPVRLDDDSEYRFGESTNYDRMRQEFLSVPAQAEHAENRAVVQSLVRSLPPVERRIIYLVDLRGMSQRKAVEILGISRNEVSLLRKNALSMMRAQQQEKQLTA